MWAVTNSCIQCATNRLSNKYQPEKVEKVMTLGVWWTETQQLTISLHVSAKELKL
jgi:hypothetical protein